MRLTVLLLAAGLLTGCSAEADPAPLPVPSAATSPSASSPTPTALALPSPKETGVAGEIERAVLAYYAAMNEGARIGSTAPYRAAYAPTCTGCEAYADKLDGYYAKKQVFRGAVTEVLSLRVVPGGTAGTGSVDLRLRVPPYVLLGPDGAVLDEFDGSEGAVSVFVGRQQDGAWKVASVVNGSG